MRVGVFLAGFRPEAGGGYTIQEDIYCSLMDVLGDSRHDFVVFSDPDFLNSHPPRESEKLKIVFYPLSNLIQRAVEKSYREFASFRTVWNRPSRLENLARTAGVEFMWFVTAFPFVVDMPYLTIVWDLQHRLQPWFPEVGANGTWYQRESYHAWFLQRAAGIVVGTHAGGRELEQFYQIPTERISILPHPTPGFAMRGPEREEPILEKYAISRGYLFYPAQFWPHKNHANLLLALQRLRDEYGLALPLVLVGSDKGNLAYIKRLADQLGLADQVHFLGFVSRDELVSLYRNALALVYMTFFGPENLPPLEAFALGCPVVASNVSGAQEQLGDAALLVDPKEPVQIAAAIKSLHDNSTLRQELIRKGSARALRWTGKDFVNGVFSILDEFESIRRCWD